MNCIFIWIQDAEKVKNWKKSFRKMPGQSYLPPCAKEYLDQHLTGDVEQPASTT